MTPVTDALMATEWNEKDEQMLAEYASARKAESTGHRVWIPPDDSHETEFDGEIERRRGRWLSAIAIGIVLIIVVPIVLAAFTSAGG